jgi:type VI secretion system secreted protein Hcp
MKSLIGIAALASAGVSTPAQAALDYFLQITGPDISGESAYKEHKGWIDVGSFSWGVSNSGIGGGGGGGSSKAFAMPFDWKQPVDSSTPKVFLGVVEGTHFKTVTFDAERSTGATFVFFKMTFQDAMFTSLKMSGGSDSIDVSGSMAYTKVTMTYVPTHHDGRPGAPITASWDFSNGVAFSGDPEALMGLFLAAPTGFDPGGLAPPVPEPASWASLIAGLGVVAALARRRRQTPVAA